MRFLLVAIFVAACALACKARAEDRIDEAPCEATLSFINRAGHTRGNSSGRLNERLEGFSLRCSTSHQGPLLPHQRFWEVGGLVNSNYGDTALASVGFKVTLVEWWRLSAYAGAAATVANYDVPKAQAARLLVLPGVFYGADVRLMEHLKIGKEEARLPLGVKIRRVTLTYEVKRNFL